MRFFNKLREALSRFAVGVHDLAAPATEATIREAEARLGARLPEPYRDFLTSWNGGFLFHDDISLYGVTGARRELEALAAVDGRVVFGATPTSELSFDAAGRVVARDLDTEAVAIVGSEFERWLDATLAREAVVYERDGEFRDEAFEGGELSEAAVRKRAAAAVKADPDSPAWREELAHTLIAEGKPDRAVKELERAVLLDPQLAGAWFALGQLRRASGEQALAATAFQRAGEAERDPEEAAFDLAHAARAAAEVSPADAAALGARVAELAPRFADDQATAAAHLVEDGDFDAAMERLSLAAAVLPDDAAIKERIAHLRARKSLRSV